MESTLYQRVVALDTEAQRLTVKLRHIIDEIEEVAEELKRVRFNGTAPDA